MDQLFGLQHRRDIHPLQGLPLYGEDATAPPVALTFLRPFGSKRPEVERRYPRPIKGSGCFYRLRWTLVD